jgi:hypothetical protein
MEKTMVQSADFGDVTSQLNSARAGDVVLLEVESNPDVDALRKLFNSPFTHAIVALGGGLFAQVAFPVQNADGFNPIRNAPVLSTAQLTTEQNNGIGGFRAIAARVIRPRLSDDQRATVRERALSLVQGAFFDTPNPSQLGTLWRARLHSVAPESWSERDAQVAAYRTSLPAGVTTSTCFGLIVNAFDGFGFTFPTDGPFSAADSTTPQDIEVAFDVEPTVLTQPEG